MVTELHSVQECMYKISIKNNRRDIALKESNLKISLTVTEFASTRFFEGKINGA